MLADNQNSKHLATDVRSMLFLQGFKIIKTKTLSNWTEGFSHGNFNKKNSFELPFNYVVKDLQNQTFLLIYSEKVEIV